MVERLYAKFYEELLRYCQALAASRAAAEDLVQETYLRALTHLEDLEDLGERERRAWLYRTARNLHIDRIRRQAREVCGAEDAADQTPFEEDWTRIAVRQMVERLPEPERTLFTLRYFQGYNATELGDLFDLTPSAVRGRLAAARRKLLAWHQDM